MTPDVKVPVELASAEVELLREGVEAWFGAAWMSDLLLAALGYASRDDLLEYCRAYLDRLGDGSTMFSPTEWTRVLMLTELAFASDVQGAGSEWAAVSGISDEVALSTLRAVQRKLLAVREFPGSGLHPFEPAWSRRG